MASINKVIIIGNCGRDPETRQMPNGDAVTNLAVATTESWKDKNTGEKKELTEWHRITLYRKLAEVAGQYLKKGSQVYIEGRLQTRKWTDKDGVERFTTEIIADTMQMLGARQSGNAPTGDDYDNQRQPSGRSASSNNGYGTGTGTGRQSAGSSAPTQSGGGAFADLDDDIPFGPVGRGSAWASV